MKLNLGCGPRRLDGFVNLDLEDGWRFEDGLPGYADGSVDAVTISHALYLVELSDWPAVFAEIFRVLRPGGVVRVTEDATDDPASERYGGYEGGRTLTSLNLVGRRMMQAGLEVFGPLEPHYSNFEDDSLIQNHHGLPPKVFHLEGVKP